MNNCFFYWVVVHALNSHKLSMGQSKDKFQLGKVSCLLRVRAGKVPCSLSWSGHSTPFPGWFHSATMWDWRERSNLDLLFIICNISKMCPVSLHCWCILSEMDVWQPFTKRNMYVFPFFMCAWTVQSTWSLIKLLLLLMWVPGSQQQCDDADQRPVRGENTHEKWNPLPPYHWATIQSRCRHCNFVPHLLLRINITYRVLV